VLPDVAILKPQAGENSPQRVGNFSIPMSFNQLSSISTFEYFEEKFTRKFEKITKNIFFSTHF